MKNEMLTQCVFERGLIADTNKQFTVGYIPSKAAKIGNDVELLEFGAGSFWKVIAVGNTMTKELLDSQAEGMRDFQHSLSIKRDRSKGKK